MGHTNSYIFEKYYQNRVVSIEISAAILKMPSRSSLLASVGHIGVDRDPRAPLHLDPGEKHTALMDRKFVAINAQIKELRASIYKEYRRPTSKATQAQSQRTQLRKLQGWQKTLRSAILKEAVLKKRRQFFNRIDNEDIRQAKCGVTVTHNPSLPVYALAARANLANIFSQVDPDGTTAGQRDRRMEALQNLINLCHIREPHHMNPASRAIKGAIEAPADDTTCTTKDAKVNDDLLHLRHSFETMELVPLALPSTICLFCLGDTGSIFQARTASFSRIDSLRRHVDEQHLAQHVEGTPLLCPHPSCDEQSPDVGAFKNHAATVHNMWLSKWCGVSIS